MAVAVADAVRVTEALRVPLPAVRVTLRLADAVLVADAVAVLVAVGERAPLPVRAAVRRRTPT